MAGTTPDGRQICFAFNNPSENCKGKCGRVHCCRKCFGEHPMSACSVMSSEGKEEARKV